MGAHEAPFIIEVIFVFFLTLYLLHQYGNWRKQHILVTIAVFVAWYFSFLIIFVLPLDVSATFYRQCQRDHGSSQHLPTISPSKSSALFVQRNNATTTVGPTTTIFTTLSNTTTHRATTDSTSSEGISSVCEKPWSYLPPNVLPDLWRVVYWASQLLSWIILPIMQSYSYAGAFTVKGKIKTALYENALWYGSYLIIFGILLVYVILKPGLQVDATQLMIILITASNTWGLLLLVLLMGYGLVEIPRTAWNYARLDYKLAHGYFKISKLSVEKEESEEQLADTLEAVRKASENIRYTDPLRKHINVIIEKCPDSSHYMFNKGTDDYVDYDDYLRETGGKNIESYTEKALVKLHKKVIVVAQTAHRTQCQWNSQLDNVFELEDVAKSAGSCSRRFKSSFRKPSDSCFGLSTCNPVLEWYWKVWLCPTLLRILTVLLLLLTAALIWSEVTFFTDKPNLSLFALLIETASKDYYYFYTELISFVTIAYMCACTYYTVFKMRVFNYYYLSPNHQTDPNSLLFSGLLLCRLTYALCLNFLALIHLDGHVTGAKDPEDTSFTNFMGHMDVLPFISNGFNLYYPMTVVLVCLSTYFSLGTRCLNCLGFQTFIIEDDLSIEYINEGKDIVRRERRKRETLNGDNRKESWSERAESAKRRLNDRSRRSERATRTEGGRDGQLNKEQATSQTNLTDSDIKYIKYSKLDVENDRVELLSATDYDPEPLTRTGYGAGSSFGRSTIRPPQNIFDDI